MFAHCSEWIKKSTLRKKNLFQLRLVLTYNASAKLPISFCLYPPSWFCWMRTEVADNCFAVVDRFAASSLRIIFVGQTGWRSILLMSARGFHISWKNVNVLVLLPRWSMFSSHTAYNFVALYVFQGLHFIGFYLLCHETISYGRRNTCIECFHMTSRRPYWCPKTMKRRPCWCPKPVLWELNSFLMQTLSFVPINLHRCWLRQRKHSI